MPKSKYPSSGALRLLKAPKRYALDDTIARLERMYEVSQSESPPAARSSKRALLGASIAMLTGLAALAREIADLLGWFHP